MPLQHVGSRSRGASSKVLVATICAVVLGLVARGLQGAFVVAQQRPATPAQAFTSGRSGRRVGALAGARVPGRRRAAAHLQRASAVARQAVKLDLTGKVAFVAGIADTSGYGWAIAKELAGAGATVLVGTWPPVFKIFEGLLKKDSSKEAMRLDDGSYMNISKIYALDAVFDVPEDVTEDVKSNKRYAGVGPFTIQEVVDQIKADYGRVDILVHSLANGPEVARPLLETSRKGYLAASSASAYSLVSMVARFAPLMPAGSSVLSLTYIASQRVIPGYGGGMSSAKAQLESDTRTLAWEAGRKYGIRVNTISAGPLKSRAASAIGKGGGKTFIDRAIDYSIANAPLSLPLYAENVGTTALCLLSDLFGAVTGVTLYVDMGLHTMGTAVDAPAFNGLALPPATPTPQGR